MNATRRSFFPEFWNQLQIEQSSVPFLTVSRRSMACMFSLQFPGEDRDAIDAGCRALEEVDALEEQLSVYRDTSEVTHVNRLANHQDVVVSDTLLGLLVSARRLAGETGGAFDFTCGALIRAWGFYRGPKRVPGASELRAALASGGYQNVRIHQGRVRFLAGGVEINPGAIGKGFAIDQALATIPNPAVLMQAGGSSTFARGTPQREPRGWQVRIGRLIRVWLKNSARVTSGADRQFFVSDGRRYGHILDPRNGWPAHAVKSASALAATAMEADALSTAFFVLGAVGARDYCRRHPSTAAILETHDGRVLVFGAADVEVDS